MLLRIQKAQALISISLFLNRCSAFYVSKLEDVDGLCHLGAEYLVFVSSRSLNTREKCTN